MLVASLFVALLCSSCHGRPSMYGRRPQRYYPTAAVFVSHSMRLAPTSSASMATSMATSAAPAQPQPSSLRVQRGIDDVNAEEFQALQNALSEALKFFRKMFNTRLHGQMQRFQQVKQSLPNWASLLPDAQPLEDEELEALRKEVNSQDARVNEMEETLITMVRRVEKCLHTDPLSLSKFDKCVQAIRHIRGILDTFPRALDTLVERIETYMKQVRITQKQQWRNSWPKF